MPDWKLKVLVQFVLAHLPCGEQLNHAFQLAYRNKERRRQEILDEVPKIGAGLALIRKHLDVRGVSVVEVGTGWVPLPTVLLYLGGAGQIVSFDHKRHLRYTLVREMLDVLGSNPSRLSEYLAVPENEITERLARLDGCSDLKSFLAAANVEYVAPGDATKTGIPPGKADLFFSYAVLEHIPEKILVDLVREGRRILRSGGLFYAYVGLHDHYAGFDRRISKVNFLKYPEWVWRLLVKNDVAYHNRLREKEFVEVLERFGGRILEIRSTVEPEDVVRVRAMPVDSRFSRFTPEECAVTTTELLATFVQGDDSLEPAVPGFWGQRA